MKKLSTLFVLLLIVLTSRAQSFEGTIKWAMKMEITDPATKAKMDEAQKKMNDPASQAKMKELQAKMNDPQMKAMMDANPAMKAQLENSMKMMQGGDMNSMTPKGMTIKIKNNNSLTAMDGGMMDKMEVLYLKDKNQSVRLDRANKTYTILSSSSGKPESTTQPKVTKTTETKTILNHLCTKYIVESTDPRGKATQQIFWTTKEINIDMKNLSQHRVGKGNQFFYDNVEGVPLRIEMVMPEGNMTMEVTELKKESLNASDFQIPSEYKEVKGGMF